MKVSDQTVREIKREVNLKVLKVPEMGRAVQSSAANMSEDFGLGASRHSSAMSSRREDLAASCRLTDV
ncbi:hypothetical protein ACFX19_026037 [Malus domestica]